MRTELCLCLPVLPGSLRDADWLLALPLGTLEGGVFLSPPAKGLPEVRTHAVTHRVNTLLFSLTLGLCHFTPEPRLPKVVSRGT